jgi:7-carboxy-7-deazaguanine synthase
MPPQPTLKIAEIFASVQGEGLRLGRPTLFVRLAGCNLRCSFCDTKSARRGGRTMTIDDILNDITRQRLTWPADWVCLTGGEPFAQEIEPLVERLHRGGFLVQAETNGTIYRDCGIDWPTVSPKPPRYEVAAGFLGSAREVKLVVSKEMTFAVLGRVRSSFPAEIPVILQPESNRPDSRVRATRLLRRSLAERLPDVRLGLQLHRVFGLR